MHQARLEGRKTINRYEVYKPVQNVSVTVENFVQRNCVKHPFADLRDDEFNHEDDGCVKVWMHFTLTCPQRST